MPQDNSLDPLMLALGNKYLESDPTPVGQKKAAVAATAERKKAELSGQSYQDVLDRRINEQIAASISSVAPAMDEFTAAREEMRGREYDTLGRPIASAIEDNVRNLAGSATTLVTGTLGAGLSLAGENLDPTRKIKAAGKALGMDVDVGPGYVAEAFSDAGRAVADVGSQIQRKLKSYNSWQAQLVAARAAERNAKSQAKHQLSYDEAIAAGGNETWEGAKKFGKDLGTAALHAAEDPNLLFDTVVEQVPSLAGGLAARGMVGARAISIRAAEFAAKAGLKEATPAMLRKAATELGRGPLALTTGSMEAGGAYAQAVGEVLSLDAKQLAAQYPEVLGRLKAGESLTDVREDIADRVATKAAMIQGLAAAGIGQLSARFALTPGTTSGLRETAADVVQEGTEEMLQGASGALAQNVSEISEGNVQTKLSDDVANSMGTSLVAGMGMPVLTESVGTAAKGAATFLENAGPITKQVFSGLGSAAVGAAKLSGKALGGLAKMRTEFDKAGEAGRQEHEEAVTKVTSGFAERLAQIPGMEGALEALNQEGFKGLSPELQARLGSLMYGDTAGTEGSPGFNQLISLPKMQRLYAQIKNDDEIEQESKDALRNQLIVTSRGVARAVSNLEALRDAAPEDQRAAYDEAISLGSAVLVSGAPILDAEAASQISPEQLKQLSENLPASPEAMAQLTPVERDQVANLMTQVHTAVLQNPNNLTSEILQKIRPLYQDMSEEDVQAFDRAQELVDQQEQYTQQWAAVNAGASGKTPNIVSNEIRNKYFALGKGARLPSMREFTSTILTAFTNGQDAAAIKQLQKLQAFAQHLRARAESYDSAALKQIEKRATDPNAFEEQTPTGFRALVGGELSDEESGWVRLNQHTSRRLMDAVRLDATHVINTYNTLLRNARPEAARAAGLEAVDALDVPRWPAALQASGFKVAQTNNYPIPSVPGSPAKPAVAESSQEPVQAAPVKTAPVAAPEAKSSGQAEASEPVVVNSDSEPTEDDIEASRAKAEQEISKGETPSRRFMRGLKFKGTLGDQNFHLIEPVLGIELQGSNDEFTAEDFKKAFPFLSDEAAKASEKRFADGAGLGEYVEILEAIEGRKELFDRNGNLFDEKPKPAKPAVAESSQEPVQAAPAETAPTPNPEASEERAEAPAKPKSRISPEQLARLTDEGLDRRLVPLEDRRATGTATEEDNLTYRALVDELERRETVAAAALEAEAIADAAREEVPAGEAGPGISSPEENPAGQASPAPADTRTLDDALDLTVDEYLAEVNPGGKELRQEDADQLDAAGVVLPADAKLVASDEDGVSFYEAADGVYATVNGTPAGYIVSQDGETVNYVAPEFRKKKGDESPNLRLGTRLAEKWIQARPFAPSGGFSPAGRRARAAAFQNLQRARAAQRGGGTMQERFPGLTDLGEKKSLRNRFLSGFVPNLRSQSVIVRSVNGLKDLFAAMNAGAAALAQMVPVDKISFSEAQLRGTKTFFRDLVFPLHQGLETYLVNVGKGSVDGVKKSKMKRIFARFFEKPEFIWTRPDKAGLHYTIAGEGQDRVYHPKVLQAMALAGSMGMARLKDSDSLVDDDTFTDMFFNGVVPQEVLELISQGAALLSGLQTDLGESAMRYMGVQVNNSASRTDSESVIIAMGGDILAALRETKMLETKTIALADIAARIREERYDSMSDSQKKKFDEWSSGDLPQLHFVVPTENAQKILSSLEENVSADTLALILNPGEEHRAIIGAPPSERNNRKIRGVGTAASAEQNRAANNMQKTAFKLNSPLRSFMDKMQVEPGGAVTSADAVLEWILGYDFRNSKTLNTIDAISVSGLNTGVRRTLNRVRDMFSSLDQYAANHGMRVEDVGVHWTADVVSNGRIMYNGFSGQSDKLLRELLTPYQDQLELDNPQHQHWYYLTLAQAFDGVAEKVHKVNQEGIQQRMEALLAADGGLGPLMAKVREIAESDSPSKAQVMELGKLMREKGFGNPSRALHALVGHVGYTNAQAAGDKTYTHRLPLELDGITDGPINALMQFGLHGQVTPFLMMQLAQGGLYLGYAGELSSNDFNSGRGKGADLYTNVSAPAMEALKKLLDGKKAYKKAADSAYRAMVRAKLANTKDQMKNALDLFTRAGPKGGFVQKGYGAGDGAVMASMMKEIVDKYYQEMSTAIQKNDGVLPDAIKAEILNLFGVRMWTKGDNVTYQDFSSSPDKRYGTASLKSRLNGDLTKFKFTPQELENARKQFELTVGEALVSTIREHMLPAIETFERLYKVTEIQVRLMQKMFQQKAKARLEELIASGEYSDADALSPDEEAKIIAELEDFAPRFEVPQAQGRGEGVMIGLKDKTNFFVPVGRTSPMTASGLDETFSQNIRATQFLNPGVRIAALINIAAGDGAMMNAINQVVRNMLNVYDGLEAGVLDLSTASSEVNQAVWNNWQYDVLGGIVSKLEKITDRDLQEFNMGDDAETFFGELMELKASSLRSKALRKAMSELRVGVHHMAALQEGAYVKDGLIIPQDEVAAWLNQRADEIMREAAAIPAPVPATGNLRVVRDGAVAGQTEPKDRMTAETFLRYLDKAHLKSANPVLRFVYKTMRKYVTGDFVAHFGTEEELTARIRAANPGVTDIRLGKHGTYFNGQLYFIGRSIKEVPLETLVHELVHAATATQSEDYYRTGGKHLSKVQREAMQDLESLAKYFVTMKYKGPGKALFANLQNALATAIEAGDMYTATQELMAWVLTNEQVGNAVRQKNGAPGIKAAAMRLLQSIRKLLGLPQNLAMESFLEQVAGQFQRVVQRQVDRSVLNVPQLHASSYEQVPLFQDLDGDSTDVEHSARLAEMIERMDAMLATLPAEAVSRAQRNMAAGVITQQRARENGMASAQAAIDAGFTFNDQELLAYKNLHAVFSALRELDSGALTEVSKLYVQAAKELTESDFLPEGPDGPNSADDVERASRMFNHVFLPARVNNEMAHEVLPTFLALVMANKQFRKNLAGIQAPSAEISREGVDEFFRSSAIKGMDVLGAAPLRAKGLFGTALVDHLLQKILQNREEMLPRTNTYRAIQDSVNTRVHELMDRGYDLAARITPSLSARSDDSKFVGALRGAANVIVTGVQGALSSNEDKAESWARALITAANSDVLPSFMQKLITEMVGMNGSNRDVYMHMDKVKQTVAVLRQRLLEQIPTHLKTFFEGGVTETESKTMFHALGRVDAQSLLGTFTNDQLRSLFLDQAALTQAIEQHVEGISDEAQELSEALGRYMVLRKNDKVSMLRRNAWAIGRATGHNEAAQVAQIDRLVTLQAIQTLPSAQRVAMAELMGRQPTGVDAVLKTLQKAAEQEKGKAENLLESQEGHRWNSWKGSLLSSADPRNDLVLAPIAEADKMAKLGWRLVRSYTGDSRDQVSGLAYYVTTMSGGKATFNQGALQTVEQTMGGSDALTGRTMNSSVQTMITNPIVVQQLLQSAGNAYGENRLLPVFNADGEIYAFERTLDPEMVRTHLRVKEDIFDSIGMWTGRTMEEVLAHRMNAELVRKMKETYDRDVANNMGDQYVDIASPRSNKVIQEAWALVPHNTRELMKETFGDRIMVRKDMVDNSIGYRSASVTDVFTGMTRLPPDVRKGLETTAFALLGKNAYKILTVSERSWQGAVGTAKDWIVVRSGRVALANMLGNQFSLMQMTGMNPYRLARIQAKKFRETETYLRNEHRIAQLAVDQAVYSDNSERMKQLEAERLALNEANRRLSIWPLVSQGLLPTIAEGLTQQDEYTLLGDGMKWIEEKASNLPPQILTGLKYATISKDTALYQGLNRMVQFGDFVAKATLYDFNTQVQKMNEFDALVDVSESFVNYNLLAGRSRDYLEQMGMTWFYNYKLRIQKIVLRNMRRNPLSFLLGGMGAEFLGADSLFSSSAPATNWTYGLGPDQITRAHEMLAWYQLTR